MAGSPSYRAQIERLRDQGYVVVPQFVPAGTAVLLSSLVVQGDVLKVEWEFDDGTPTLVEEGKVLHEWELHPTQETEVTHTFEGAGPGGHEPTVTEKIHTDNLDTPEIVKTRKLKLNLQAPQVTHNPASQSVAEGAEAQFTASASGTPKPRFGW